MIKNPILNTIGLVLMLLSTVACSSPSQKDSAAMTPVTAPQSTPNRERTIVLGDVSNNPRKEIRQFQPLANYLSTNLSQFDHGQVKIAPDLATMIAWLKTGEVDIYFDSPYPAMRALNQAQAKPILRRWKKGQAEYHSLIFTKSEELPEPASRKALTLDDRQISSLSDLKGKTVAFDHPASTTGFMLPLSELIEADLSPQEVRSTHSSVAGDQVGYVFSYEDSNSIEWLLSGKVAAAAIDNHSFDKLPTAIKEQTLILAETEKVARHLVLVQPNMSPKLIKDISAQLLLLEETEPGRAVLEQFDRTKKFDSFPVGENLTRMQELYQQAEQQ